MKLVFAVCSAWFILVLALFAQVVSAYDPNRFVSAQSPTYRGWAPIYGPYSGGIIFGKGATDIILGELDSGTSLNPNDLDLQVNENGNLVIQVARNGEFEVAAHFFAVCPMARHVARNAPLGYTLPPYFNQSVFKEARLLSDDGYIAEEFVSDARMARLVRAADFWPSWEYDDFRAEYALLQEVKDEILGDVNSVEVSVEGLVRAHGFTYFIGDFHLNTVISLVPGSNLAKFYGWPLTYYTKNQENQMVITDLDIMAERPETQLTDDYDNFLPADFKSLFDLAATFVFFRSAAPEKLAQFISLECPNAPLQ